MYDRRGVAEEDVARFMATIELAPVGIAHVAIDGRFVMVNQRFCRLVGYDGEELLQRSFQDLTHPADLAADLAQAMRTLAGSQDGYAMEKRYIRKDGVVIWVILHGRLVREAATREPLYFIAIVEDITERKVAEYTIAELRADQERARDALIRTLQDEVSCLGAGRPTPLHPPTGSAALHSFLAPLGGLVRRAQPEEG